MLKVRDHAPFDETACVVSAPASAAAVYVLYAVSVRVPVLAIYHQLELPPSRLNSIMAVKQVIRLWSGL